MEYFVDRLRQELKTDEGCKYQTYMCSQNYLTAGIGHMIRQHEFEYNQPVGTVVSKEKVNNWFEQDIQVTLDDCKKVYDDWDALPEEVKLICANMMFQLGRPRYSGFKKKIQAVKDGLWLEAANQMRQSRWYKQTTNRADRLISRMKNVATIATLDMITDV